MSDLTNKVFTAQSAVALLEALETFMDTTDILISNERERYAQTIRDVPYMLA